MNHNDPRTESVYDLFVIGAFKFPQGDASSQRMLTLAQASAAAGRVPLVINDGDSHAPSNYRTGTVAAVGGVDYICLPSPRGGRLRRLSHRVFRPLRLARLLRDLGRPGARPWVLAPSGLCTPGVLLVLRLLGGYPIVADVVERHDASQFQKGWRAPYFLRHRATSWLSGVACDRVIVISTRLARQYASMKRRPLVIPALVDLSEYPSSPELVKRSGVTLLYIGNPAGKDRLGIILDALAQIAPSDRLGVRFIIAGLTHHELAISPDIGQLRLDRLGGVVEAPGFVPRANVLQLLRDADFTVLIRPSGGYADAGFPTKVPESLAAGCPILGNITSDLGDYLVDGENAVICQPQSGSNEVSVAAIREGILRIIEMSAEERFAMRQNAMLSAAPLSSKAWGARLAQFLETSS